MCGFVFVWAFKSSKNDDVYIFSQNTEIVMIEKLYFIYNINNINISRYISGIY